MLRSEAVQRLNEGFGFRAAGHIQEGMFIRRLIEAQKDLENGKTLPRFLLQEDQDLVLLANSHTADLPTGFLRVDDENPLHYTAENGMWLNPLIPMRYSDAIMLVGLRQHPDESQLQPIAPSVYVIRKTDVDFITTANQDYTFRWNYYKMDDTLDSDDTENMWLVYAADWLIGEAGERIARSLRDAEGLAEFQELKQKGRAAVFGDIIADEDAIGQIKMGAWL